MRLSGSNSLTRVQQRFEQTCYQLSNLQNEDPKIHVHAAIRLIHLRIMKGEIEVGGRDQQNPDKTASISPMSERGTRMPRQSRASSKPNPQIRPIHCFGFHTVQSTYPILSITVGSIGVALQSSELGVIEFGGGVGRLEIRDEFDIAPLPLSTIYSNISSFARDAPQKEGRNHLLKYL